MPKLKQIFEEERASLLDHEKGLDVFHRFSYPAYQTAITKGVSGHVGKWPSHMFAAFLAASLVFAAFILFALVTALFCIPTASHRCRKVRALDIAEFPKIFFVKHANRTWSREEFCYVESSARKNPEINVYIVNLLNDGSMKNGSFIVKNENYEKMINVRRNIIETLVALEDDANNSIDETIDLSSNITDETRARKILGLRYHNVRNVDITIDDFFQGSILAHVCHDLDVKTLEIAARANLLWNTPGVALEPSEYRRIDDSKRFLCKKGCKVEKNATIDSRGSFQASGVPCQAFVGYLMREIMINGMTGDRDVVKRAADSFCRSLRECPGLEIPKDQYSPSVPKSPYCPEINSRKILTRVEKFDTGSAGFLR